MRQSNVNSKDSPLEYDILNTELGRRLSTEEVAAYLGLDEDTIRKHYVSIGGIRPTGPKGKILFFERNIVRALRREHSHAFEDQEEWTDSMAGQSSEEWGYQTEEFQNQKGSSGMGKSGKKNGLVEDKHGIFSG